MNARKMIVPAMICILLLCMIGPANAVYQIGDHVNNFTLPNQFNEQVSLYDYQDRIVVMAFWFYG